MVEISEFKRYSPVDRDSVHADMRIAPAQTRRAMARQRAVVRAHEGCQVCAELDPVRAYSSARRAKVGLTIADVAGGLNLPPGARPVRMYVSDDPQVLWLVFEADELEPAPLAGETPVAVLPAVDE